jgi:hypothetical protein
VALKFSDARKLPKAGAFLLISLGLLGVSIAACGGTGTTTGVVPAAAQGAAKQGNVRAPQWIPVPGSSATPAPPNLPGGPITQPTTDPGKPTPGGGGGSSSGCPPPGMLDAEGRCWGYVTGGPFGHYNAN